MFFLICVLLKHNRDALSEKKIAYYKLQLCLHMSLFKGFIKASFHLHFRIESHCPYRNIMSTKDFFCFLLFGKETA